MLTGSAVTFTCNIEVSVSILSTVIPVAIWRRDGTQLSNNSRINVSELVSTGSTSSFESNLTINSIEAADSGNYTCEATLVLIATSNVVSTNSSLISIAVEGEPDMFQAFHFCSYIFEEFPDQIISLQTIDQKHWQTPANKAKMSRYIIIHDNDIYQ